MYYSLITPENKPHNKGLLNHTDLGWFTYRAISSLFCIPSLTNDEAGRKARELLKGTVEGRVKWLNENNYTIVENSVPIKGFKILNDGDI